MKRAPFLGATAASILAGCGGHQTIRALPGVALNTSTRKATPTFSGRLVPETADPIPSSVLSQPIISETRRFDGKAAPPGWQLAQGQRLSIAENRQLFNILGSIAGGDGKTTFKLPNTSMGVIIAVAGMFPTSPTALKSSGRHMAAVDSLGPNAVPSLPRMLKSPSAQLLADRRLITAGVRVGAAKPVPMAPETVARIERARSEARETALSALSAGTRARLAAVTQRYLAGGISLYDGVVQLAGVLSSGEVDGILSAADSMTRTLASRGLPSLDDRRGEASRFIFSVTVTNDQIAAATARGIELR